MKPATKTWENWDVYVHLTPGRVIVRHVHEPALDLNIPTRSIEGVLLYRRKDRLGLLLDNDECLDFVVPPDQKLTIANAIATWR